MPAASAKCGGARRLAELYGADSVLPTKTSASTSTSHSSRSKSSLSASPWAISESSSCPIRGQGQPRSDSTGVKARRSFISPVAGSNFLGVAGHAISSPLSLLSNSPGREAPGSPASSSSPLISLSCGLLNSSSRESQAQGVVGGSGTELSFIEEQASTGGHLAQSGCSRNFPSTPSTRSFSQLEELSPSPPGFLSSASGAYPPWRSPAGLEGGPQDLSRSCGQELSGGADMNTPPSSLGSTTTTATTTTTTSIVTSICGNSVTAIPFSSSNNNSGLGGTAASAGNTTIRSGEDCKPTGASTSGGEAASLTTFGTSSSTPNALAENSGLFSTGNDASGRDFTSTTSVGNFSGGSNIISNNSSSSNNCFSTSRIDTFASDNGLSGLNVTSGLGSGNTNLGLGGDGISNANHFNIKPDSCGAGLQLQQIKTGTVGDNDGVHDFRESKRFYELYL